MKLTTKGRYAITAMLYLAMHNNKKAIPLAEISKQQNVSLSYLEQLFTKLRRQNLVQSLRGPNGGYKLSQPPALTIVATILHAVNEPLDIRKCQGKSNCNNNAKCITHNLWADLSNKIDDFLSGVSLKNLIDNNQGLK